MKDVLFALLHLTIMAGKLCGPGGVRAVMAENLLLKQQLIVLRRGRQRAPNLRRSDLLLCGFWSLFLKPPAYPKHRRRVSVCLLKSSYMLVPLNLQLETSSLWSR
jgi:hypothetical protein